MPKRRKPSAQDQVLAFLARHISCLPHLSINPFRHICSIAYLTCPRLKLLLRIPRVYQAHEAHVFKNRTIHESVPGGRCDSTPLTKPNRTKKNSLTPYEYALKGPSHTAVPQHDPSKSDTQSDPNPSPSFPPQADKSRHVDRWMDR